MTASWSVGIPTPVVDRSKCSFCGRCTEVCAYHAIAVINPIKSTKLKEDCVISPDASTKVRRDVLVFPELCHGCGSCSLFCPEGAVSEIPREIGVIEMGKAGAIDFFQGRLKIGEPMASPVIRELKKRIGEKERERGAQNTDDYLVIRDIPPGTSCPVVEAMKGSDFAVLVSEPTPFGLYDLKLAVAMVKKMKIPCGIIVNRDGVEDDSLQDYSMGEGIPILMRIPMNKEIAVAYSRGVPLVEIDRSYKNRFRELYRKITDLS